MLLLVYGVWHLFSGGSTRSRCRRRRRSVRPQVAAAKPAPAPATRTNGISRSRDAGAFSETRDLPGRAVRQHVVIAGARFNSGQAGNGR